MSIDNNNALHESCSNLRKKIEQANAAKKAALAAIDDAKPKLLPLVWDDVSRCVPNVFLRSALFGAIRRGVRRYMFREQIYAQGNIKIVYTGARLDQGDLDAWETVLHLARSQKLGTKCCFTAYQFLKLINKSDTGSNREILLNRMTRIKATALDIKVDGHSYEGSLINDVYKSDENCKYVVQLNPKLVALFAADQFTKIDWLVRQALDGKPLAQWLHGYYASHAKPYDVSVATLLQMSGSENDDLYSGKQKIAKALDAVKSACKLQNQLFSYAFKGNIISVEKTASKSQSKHLKLRNVKE